MNNKYSTFFCIKCKKKWVKNKSIRTFICFECNSKIFKMGFYYFHCYNCKKNWREYIKYSNSSRCNNCKLNIPIRIKNI